MRWALPITLACLTWAGVALAHDGVSVDIAVLDAQLVHRPNDASLLLARAALHRREGSHPKALADCDRALAIDGSLSEGWVERGLVLLALGRFAEAEAELTRYLALATTSSPALIGRAKSREFQGKLREARDDYDAAVKLGGDPELYLARGHVDELLGDLERAAKGYEEGLHALHGAVVLWQALVRVERARGRSERALSLVDEALEKASFKGDLRLLRGDVLADLKRAKEARLEREAALAEIDAAMKKRPTDLRRLSRVRALLALGRKAEARRELDFVLASSPALEEAKALAQSPAFSQKKP